MYYIWRHSQVVRQRSATPLFTSSNLVGAFKYRGVEQLEARRAHNPKVTGSNPVSATIMKKASAE